MRNLTYEQWQHWTDSYDTFMRSLAEDALGLYEQTYGVYTVGDRVRVEGEVGTIAHIEPIFPSPYQVHFDNGAYGDYPKTKLEAVK